MYIITSNCILNVELADVVYVPENNVVRFERAGTYYELKDIPEDAMQQIAMGIAEGKRFIEFDDAKLILEANG